MELLTWPVVAALLALNIPVCVQLCRQIGEPRWKGLVMAPIVTVLVIGGLMLAEKTLWLTMLLAIAAIVIGLLLITNHPLLLRLTKHKHNPTAH